MKDWDGTELDGRGKTAKTYESKANKMRNLAQYRKLSDEEFEEVFSKMEMNSAPSAALEKRIGSKLKEFAIDYDISDLKMNDKLILRALIQALLQLEDLEQYANKLREEGLNPSNIAQLREYNNMMTGLRKDISTMQEDLKITRKHRKGDKEANVMAYVEDLKAKAKQFYEETMTYVYCPKCNQLLGTFWIPQPIDKKNRLRLYCQRDIGDGNKCETEVIVNPKEALEERFKIKETVPESLL